MEHKAVEESVLDVYRRVSPSYREMGTEKDFHKNLEQRTAILTKLNLHPIWFKGKRVLEIGGGTGENSIFYSLWGADVTIVEPNEISCNRATELFKEFDKTLSTINKSLFDIEPNIFQDFDIIIAEGVLHHTFNTMKALDLILKNANKDTLIMIAIPEYHGWFKRNLQRKLISSVSGAENEIVENSKKYFQNHIDRAVKYGLRTEESVIYDTFVNPQIETTKLEEICFYFYKNKFNFYSSYPSMNIFFETQPWSKNRVNLFDYKTYVSYFKTLEKVWACSGEEDFKSEISNITGMFDRVDKEYGDLLELKTTINNKSFKVEDLKPIQNGYMGIGMNYFVGIKE
ncbi:methylase involved in ubiquinone/menaquinone biosynthesis [Thiovulum sp. ES]|nr:methylase involved in ubiquinone/menaquinone biosynthesis [Thiovulum sp. ES]